MEFMFCCFPFILRLPGTRVFPHLDPDDRRTTGESWKNRQDAHVLFATDNQANITRRLLDRGGFWLRREWKQGGLWKRQGRVAVPKSQDPLSQIIFHYLRMERKWSKGKFTLPPGFSFPSERRWFTRGFVVGISWPSRFTFRLSARSRSRGRVMQCSSSAHRNDC